MKKTLNAKIIIIEAGHLSKKAISGGDKLIQAMIPYLANNLTFEIIIPKIAQTHWKAKKAFKIHILEPIFLEKYPSMPVAVFLIYLWRSFYLAKHLLTIPRPYILYSSSAEIADWLAPCLIKIFLKDVKWIVRIHHLRENPIKRPGNTLTNLFSFLIERLGLLCFKKSDLILTLNTNIKRKISRIVPAKRIETLSAGIDFKKISQLKPYRGTPYYDAVFLGRVHYTKGVLDLPEIWKFVVDKLPRAKLAIIGELSIPQLEKQLKMKIDGERLQKSIDVLGYLPQKDTFSILKKSKVFLFTDHEAGFGIAVAEAMGAGLPAIGWDIGIFGDVFKAGYIKIPLNNKRLFARMVIRILRNDKLRKTLSDRAITEARKFNWYQISRDFEKFLKEL